MRAHRHRNGAVLSLSVLCAVACTTPVPVDESAFGRLAASVVVHKCPADFAKRVVIMDERDYANLTPALQTALAATMSTEGREFRVMALPEGTAGLPGTWDVDGRGFPVNRTHVRLELSIATTTKTTRRVRFLYDGGLLSGRGAEFDCIWDDQVWHYEPRGLVVS
jgi:hypothetical protein